MKYTNGFIIRGEHFMPISAFSHRFDVWRIHLFFLSLICIIFISVCTKKNPTNTEPESENPIVLPDGYENRYYQGMRYGLFIPPSYDPQKSYPLITQLHGSTDTTSWDLGWYHAPVQTTDPCFVITPKTNTAYAGWGTTWMTNHTPDMRKTLELIDSLLVEFNIDPNRLYINGTSMGGFGVFSVLVKEPGKFAGAFSICGGGDAGQAAIIMQTPLWMFHGSADDVVSVAYSRDMYQAITNLGGRHARYTEYPGVGHAAWEPAWQEPTLVWWLLAQRKGVIHGVPDKVENFSYERSGNNIVKLSWNPPSDQTKPNNQIWYYKLFRNYTVIAEMDNIETSYRDENLTAATYIYSIAAVNYFFEMSSGSGTLSVIIP
jgi:hypothetical protein